MANDTRFGFKIDKGLSQSWELQFIVASGTSASIVSGAPVKSTTYKVTGLTQNTAYLFTVKAINAGGTVPWQETSNE